MKKALQIMSYVLVALIASAATLFFAVREQGTGYSKLEQLEALITDRFIGEVDNKEINDAAAHAMVGALGDRWSYYIPADQYSAYKDQMNNSYVGIGVTVREREDGTGIDILEVTKGGPAEEAGLLAGDVIVGVDGQTAAGSDLDAIKNLIRGEQGTKVTLTVRREGKNLEIPVTRRLIQTPVAVATLLDNGIGLVTIENFDARCRDESVVAIESLLEQGATKLIFDVRNNPGGYKHELVALLDYLLPEGLIFRSEYYDGTTEEERSDAKCLDIPMAVLINGDSYSAAEFFAAALQDYDKAVIVGEKTCGKGYFQATYQLNDGSAVGLSVGKYYTPKGISLAGVGITPEIEIVLDAETAASVRAGTLAPEQDPHIQAAVDALTAG